MGTKNPCRSGVAFADGKMQPVDDVGRADDGEFIVKMSERHGLPVQKVMDIMADLQEESLELMAAKEAAMDSMDSMAEHFWRRALMAVFAYQGSRAFALECLVLALGTATKQGIWFDILGCRTQVELAERWNGTKQNVEKCMGGIQDVLKLSGVRGQAARANMVQAREKQLR